MSAPVACSEQAENSPRISVPFHLGVFAWAEIYHAEFYPTSRAALESCSQEKEPEHHYQERSDALNAALKYFNKPVPALQRSYR